MILIPPDKLEEGYIEGKKRIESLLESATILHRNKQYSESLALTILASEEVTKLALIQDHLDAKIGITKEEWDKFTVKRNVHKTKLTIIQSEARKKLEHISDDHYKRRAKLWPLIGYPSFPKDVYYKLVLDLERRYEKLARVKNWCFYLDWQDSDWKTFSKRQPILMKQEILSFYYLMMAKYDYYTLISVDRFDVLDFEINKFFENPDVQKHLNLRKMKNSYHFIMLSYLSDKILDEL